MNREKMIEAYLERLELTGIDRRPTRENLQALQQAHLYHIPYENLDVMRGVPLSLEIDDLFRKIVLNHRGGYCFELNGLFSWLLGELGYEVTGYFARFLRSAGDTIPMRGHQVMRVQPVDCEEAYLVDAATGCGSPDTPICLKEGALLTQPTGRYRMTRQADGTWLLQEWREEAWQKLYSFSEEPQLPVDYRVASYFCEHAPESTSRQKWIVNLRTLDGRYTVDGDQFKHFEGDQVEVIVPQTQEERDRLLKQWYGIVL